MTVSPLSSTAASATAAAAGGLLDAAYDLVETPVGTLLVAATDLGLCRISFEPDGRRARRRGRQPRAARPARLDEAPPPARRVLRRRAASVRPRRSTCAPRRSSGGAARARARAVRARSRRTASWRGGSAGRARRAPSAAALNRNPVPIVLPCHRVVGATGSLVGYAGGLDRKRTLLELEGAAA